MPCPQFLPHGEGSTQWVLPALFMSRLPSLSSLPGAPSSSLFPLGASNHMEMPLEGAHWFGAWVVREVLILPLIPGCAERLHPCAGGS